MEPIKFKLFKNDKKTDKSPDRSGSLVLPDGTKVRIAAWANTDGSFGCIMSEDNYGQRSGQTDYKSNSVTGNQYPPKTPPITQNQQDCINGQNSEEDDLPF